MRDYVERAKSFIAKIYPYIQNCRDQYEFENAVYDFNRDNHRHVYVAYGSTRIALITSDYVIKVNYNGWGSGRFGACADEVRMYRKAVEDGFEYLLAKITPYRKNYNRTFYIMPKINGIERTPCDAETYVTQNEYDWLCYNIGDRHNQNYGWKDGHIVMVDYAYNTFTGY